ncbi:MAG: bifunctional phosphopantothenoylcysteine decarboxylase/phosphopantothenate--cysteine ligase CoaBC [Deltaproteobacteria bacterium]|nr:bifunctional phosphopantothenoylcysteine decarboxylase/phosphopantothenate--cysteine ligase CoaBC [Deltaproteobacteria bacterium]
MSESMERRRIVLGVTGSIAAYKAAELARILVSRGYEVRVVMTQSGMEFITPTTMQAVTGQPVVTDFWDKSEASGIGHIQLADWAEALVIAPATADVIAKLAMGFAESPLLAVALATKAPILVAPAMNMNMYSNPKTQENIEELRKRGVRFVDPEEGELACGWNGTGRLADPEEIFFHVRRILSPQDFAGKRVLITTGPTREALDPVRFITNRSSGKMGVALAREAFRRGAEVTLVHGPVHIKVPGPVKREEVTSTAEMRKAVMDHMESKSEMPDVVIMAAAVADYRPAEVADLKMKKSDKTPTIKLVENPDILHELGKSKVDEKKPILVGFAVETGEIEDLLNEARTKLKNKNADMIVGNFANEAFDLDTNRVWLVDKHGRQEEVATTYKSRVANKILDTILTL